MESYYSSSGRVSKALRKTILERDGYKCVECGFVSFDRPSFLHIDHKHPVSKGGSNTSDNLRTLCVECNLKKSNMSTKCPNCRVDVDAGKPSCPNCGHILFINSPTLPHKSKSFDTTLIRRLLLVVAVLMLTYGLWGVAANAYSYLTSMSLFSFLRGSGGHSKVQTSAPGVSCSVVSSTGKANFKRNCDSKDCDNDPVTVSGVANVGQTVIKTGNTVESSVPSVGVWSEVTTSNNETFYIASSKLSCN